MGQPTLLIVVPTYNHFDYAVKAASSALTGCGTFLPKVLLIDDASPTWPKAVPGFTPGNFYCPGPDAYFGLKRDHPDDVFFLRFDENGGLTRSWNRGLQVAKEMGFDACCVTNSDVVFPKGWDADIFVALNTSAEAHRLDLVGPVTNAPGSNPEQHVGRYSCRYERQHAERDIQKVQDELFLSQSTRFKRSTLNGFCMTAWTQTWWNNAFDSEHVFRPRNDFNSKGQPNPTPLMTLNEYELQARWHAKGLKTGIALASYVFHYRAVSRGDEHRRGDWVRMKAPA